MAHGEDTRRAVRASYVFDQLGLEIAAQAHGVPVATARRWIRESRLAGDDWEKARSAQLIAGGGLEDVVRQTLAIMVQQTQATVEAIRTSEDMPPAAKVQALASLADSHNKMTAALRRVMPETDAMAVRLDTVKRLGEFVRARHPRHAAAFSEILEPFAAELVNG